MLLPAAPAALGCPQPPPCPAQHSRRAIHARPCLLLPLQCAELLDILLTAGSGAPDAPEAVPVGELPEPEEAAGCSAEAVVKALLEAGVLAVKA